MEEMLFRERQYFRQWFIWIILGGIDLLFLWALIQQAVLGRPFGDKPAGTVELLVVFGFLMVFTVFMAAMHLRTEITREAISIAFFPLMKRTYRWEDIAEARVREYRPLLEYGGWGIRFGRGGMAYTTSGRMGLELTLKKGKKVLIGTQQPEELRLLLHNRAIK